MIRTQAAVFCGTREPASQAGSGGFLISKSFKHQAREVSSAIQQCTRRPGFVSVLLDCISFARFF
jgi:hypothetical protein